MSVTQLTDKGLLVTVQTLCPGGKLTGLIMFCTFLGAALIRTSGIFRNILCVSMCNHNKKFILEMHYT